MCLRLAVLFTILIIGGVISDNCQRQTNDSLAGQTRANILRHEQRGILRKRITESTRKYSKPISKRNSNRNTRLNDNNNNRYILFTVTAYTKNDRGMNGKGITASGKRARHMHTIAASRGYKFNTHIYLPSLGRIVVVEDRGGAIKGNRIDLYMNSRAEAIKFGKRKIKGVVLN